MMWTMGYNDGVDSVNNNQDPLCTGRKLRQLLPRPNTTHDHFLALNRYHLAVAEQNRRDLVSTRQVVASSRWNPTPDQLHALEELYRRGTRSPSTDQIQQITAQLRRYGKIEGKNVFYWFQNHKARERQKRRRQFESTSGEHQHHYNINGDESGENRDSSAVANKTPHEVEQTKNRTTESGTTAHQKTLPRQAGTTKTECEAAADHGWAQYPNIINYHDAELLQQRKNATWHTMQLPCYSYPTKTNLINSCSSGTTVTNTIPSTFVSSSPTEIMTAINPRESINNNIFLEPQNIISSQIIDDDRHHVAQTLQLFPVRRSTNEKCVDEEEEDEQDSAMLSVSSSSACSSNYQFFEFLPVKNC